MKEPARVRFRDLVTTRLLNAFVDAPARRAVDYQLDLTSLERVSEHDAEWFVRTIEAGLVTMADGDVMAPRSTAKERIFWHGPKAEIPRRLSVVIEPIIGIGAIGRLHIDHGWPVDLLGLQPATWAFDFAAYGNVGETPVIVGEVKSKRAEIDAMCAHFEQSFDAAGRQTSTAKENWEKKISWFQGSGAQIIWALGPDGYERIYQLSTELKTGKKHLVRRNSDILDYQNYYK